jgi:hypothetical protein
MDGKSQPSECNILVDLAYENGRPRVKPRSITERNPQELRSLPRFPHLIFMEKAGQAAQYSNPAKAG